MCYNKIGWQSSIKQNTLTSYLLQLQSKWRRKRMSVCRWNQEQAGSRDTHLIFIISSHNKSTNKLIICLICISEIFLINFCSFFNNVLLYSMKMWLILLVSISCQEKQHEFPRELHLQGDHAQQNFHLSAKVRFRYNACLSL